MPVVRVSAFLRELDDGVVPVESYDYHAANSIMQKYSPNFPLLTEQDWGEAKRAYDQNNSLGIELIGINDKKYPRYLKTIKDAPPILFIKGNTDIFRHLPGIAIVGARSASKNGLEIARRLSQYCVENNWVVVSGLALGIDAAAHQGALDSNGKTIAVLASGLDKASPQQNAGLADRILENNGAWVSEHSIGVPPKKYHFVPRNRIQIGLSVGSIIVEAQLKSGSFSQANFCVRENRALFAVIPENSTNNLRLNSDGTLEMVNSLGALPIKSRNDYSKMLQVLSDKRSLLIRP